MVHLLLDTTALVASCVALGVLARLKKSYFLDSRFFMGGANLGFIVILVQQFIADASARPPYQTLYTVMISEMALCVGFASYLLSRNDGRSGSGKLTEFVISPPKPFIAYAVIVICWTTATLLYQPWELRQTTTLDGSIFYYRPDTWYILSSSILLIAFITFPVLSLYRQGTILSDPEVATSTKIISLSWASFGIVALVQAAAIDGFALIQSIGTVVDSLLFIMIVFALKEPTILSRILSGSEDAHGPAYQLLSLDTIALYNVESDRRKLVEAFVRRALASGQGARCFVSRNELPYYTAIIRDTRFSLGLEDAKISIHPLEPGRPDDGATNSVPGFSRTAVELIDLGELDISQCRKVTDRIKALDVLPGPNRKPRVWAVNVERAHPSLLNMIREISHDARTLDLAQHQESFSALIGRTHQGILGTRILVEYEPSSSYEQIVQKFVGEFQANVEPAAVFTSVGSPVHREVQNLQDLRLFSFSTKTSTPTKISDGEVLLPERDSSLLLDAVDKLLQGHQGGRIGLAFDVFTDLILFQGFDKIYGVLSSIVEMIESESATAVILINYTALDERALGGVRGLFGSQMRYGPEGPELIRFRDLEKTERVPAIIDDKSDLTQEMNQ